MEHQLVVLINMYCLSSWSILNILFWTKTTGPILVVYSSQAAMLYKLLKEMYLYDIENFDLLLDIPSFALQSTP